MRILAHIATYGHNAASGADKMMQSLLEYLAVRGCECKVVINDCNKPYELNGVQVQTNKSLLGEQYDWCDVVLIHLVSRHEANIIAPRFNKPIIHLCHNAHIKPQTGYIIYNSSWLATLMNLPLPSIVVHPPIKVPESYLSSYLLPHITLVNTCDNKGGSLLIELAKQAYQYKFLGIHGGYGMQMQQPITNVQYRPYNPDGVDYSTTRILIIPSKMESWSMAASEAMAQGIPVICSDLLGLRENCGDAAVYATTVKDYLDEIKKLDDKDYYDERAKNGFHRVRLHNYAEELNNLYNFIENIAMKEKKEIKPKKEKKEIKPIKKKQRDIS